MIYCGIGIFVFRLSRHYTTQGHIRCIHPSSFSLMHECYLSYNNGNNLKMLTLLL